MVLLLILALTSISYECITCNGNVSIFCKQKDLKLYDTILVHFLMCFAKRDHKNLMCVKRLCEEKQGLLNRNSNC